MTQAPESRSDPAFKPVTSDVATAALSRLQSLYQSRAQEIRDREIGGRFRLAGENEFVPADISYIAGKIEALLDKSRAMPDRLGQGTDAVTALIAGFRTTEMSEFGIAAHDVLDYVSAVSDEGARDGSAGRDFKAVQLAPLEQQLKALETSCTCR